MIPTEGSPLPGPEPGRATVLAGEALDGLPVAGSARLAEAQLTPAVATTLRAALELVLPESRLRRPLRVTLDDGALEIHGPIAHPERLLAAGKLLEAIEGSCGEADPGSRSVFFRVPVAGPRSLFLMVEQGPLGLAVPWHAVLRVRLVPADAIEAWARRDGVPVLSPFVSLPTTSAERPVVLLGYGMRRAYLVADRLIWRMPAEPVANREPIEDRRVGHPVCTADGEVFWVTDPGRLLRDFEPAPLHSNDAAPPGPEPTTAPRPLPRELRPIEVEPLGATVEPPARAPAPPPVAAALPAVTAAMPEQTPRARARRPRALVAEDSIVGRIFLGRLLERHGFDVELVSRVSELEAALSQEWTLVCADVDLPDSPAGGHLAGLRDRSGSAICVALVRDVAEGSVAGRSGVHLLLLKPFESGQVERVLIRAGLLREIS